MILQGSFIYSEFLSKSSFIYLETDTTFTTEIDWQSVKIWETLRNI